MSYRGFLSVALALTGACTSPGAPFPMLGERAALTGQWEGSYQSSQTGRRGTIQFRFGSGTDSAAGTVRMTPLRAEHPVTLRISYIWCGGSDVTGRLDPYVDPKTGEQIYTTFEGKLVGGALSGAFSTLYPDRGRLLEGTWSVKRIKPQE